MTLLPNKVSLLENKITLLIPFFNEGNRIFETLKLMVRVKNVHEIICVDDGSKDNNYKKIQKLYPKIKVFRLEKNQGKSSAILFGLVAVKTQWVFLLDADLKNLQISEIQAAIKTVINTSTTKKTKQLDMLVLRRSNITPFVTAIRHDILMSGERILQTKDALEVFKNPFGGKPPTGYQLEVAINLYMLENNKKCYWQQTSLANSYKINKWTFSQAIQKYLDEIFGYMSYAGPIKYLQQLINFCKNEYVA